MTITFPDGPTITCGMAITTAVSTYGRWDVDVWGSATWGPDEVLTDIADYLMGFSTRREFDRSTGEWRTATGQLILDNSTSRFDPDDPASPYTVAGVNGLLPWRATVLTATYNTVTYPIMRAYTGDWSQSTPREAPTATVPLRDEWAKLSAAKAIGIPSDGAGDSFGARINRILDAVGHHRPRDVEPGVTTMQATTLPAEAVRELELAAASEGGMVWPDQAGTVTARGRYHLIEEDRSLTSQATFGTGAGEISYTDPVRDTATDRIINSITWTRANGGTAQTVENATSISLYDKRTESPRTDLMVETDAQMYDTVAWRLMRSAAYQRSLESITIWPQKDPTTMWPIALGLREWDLVTVLERRTWGTVTRYCHISGIAHDVTAGQWKTVFTLLPASQLLALGDSRWDYGTWGADPTDTTGARWI